MTRAAIAAVIGMSGLLACSAATSTPPANLVGTWGVDNAGMIVSATDIHVHIGCTLGDANTPIQTDANGQFQVEGTYNVDAYPVNRGITHPAVFNGRIVGQSMVLTVTLSDTARVLGPVTLIYGKEPKMGPCPICRAPKKPPAS